MIGEGAAGMGARVKAWKHSQGINSVAGVLFWCGPLQVLQTGQVLRESQLDEFIQSFALSKPALVVLDTLARCMVGGDEDSAKDMGVFIAGIERLRTELDATILVVHHPTKNGKVERGSGALRGAVDTVLQLTESAGVITMRCEKQKEAAVFQDIFFALRAIELPDGTQSCVVVDSLPPQRPVQDSVRGGRILTTLAAAPTGMTKANIQAALRDVKERTLYRWLRDLRDDGSITLEKGVYRLGNERTATAIPLP